MTEARALDMREACESRAAAFPDSAVFDRRLDEFLAGAPLTVGAESSNDSPGGTVKYGVARAGTAALKILHIGKYYAPFKGGVETYLQDALKALAARGDDCQALVHNHAAGLHASARGSRRQGLRILAHRAQRHLDHRLLHTLESGLSRRPGTFDQDLSPRGDSCPPSQPFRLLAPDPQVGGAYPAGGALAFRCVDGPAGAAYAAALPAVPTL